MFHFNCVFFLNDRRRVPNTKPILGFWIGEKELPRNHGCSKYSGILMERFQSPPEVVHCRSSQDPLGEQVEVGRWLLPSYVLKNMPQQKRKGAILACRIYGRTLWNHIPARFLIIYLPKTQSFPARHHAAPSRPEHQRIAPLSSSAGSSPQQRPLQIENMSNFQGNLPRLFSYV